jgi:hypothetical protein
MKLNLQRLFGITKDQASETPMPIASRVDTDTSKPLATETVDPDTKSLVAYGSKKKKTDETGIGARKIGAGALKIPFNVGNTKGAGTGGLNV